MMIKRNRYIVYACLMLATGTLLMLGACAGHRGSQAVPASPADSAVLTAGEWQMTSLAGTHVSADAGVTLVFDEDGRLYGYSGCNNYFGTWQLKDGALTFGPMGSTKRACEEKAMRTEYEYFRTMTGVTRALRGHDGSLVLAPAADAPVQESLVFIRK
ncbi:META domain-containing protein [Oleidesulfovibrio alaskensis]|jgi:heat shock protein HslJ|uniref:META domain-containing protein n=1 Tax=Oleidesulfovibrio alaskensis TaxID=58180 RepID=UPI001A5EF860|nr:META domain-containing protein [Oleidesulfovibrio alaskensis]MBL3582563.1 META domain-containing protein [Oleidesulfovibrio alaskensis]